MHESTLISLITLIELLVHTEREQHSLRVIAPDHVVKQLQRISLQTF